MNIGTKQVTSIGGLKADTWVRIYSNTLAAAATSVTISGLDGNTDVEWILRFRGIGAVDSTSVLVRPNNDSGTNYGYQYLQGSNVTVSAARNTNTGLYLASLASTTNDMVEMKLYAKSGFVRTSISEQNQGISGTTVNAVDLWGQAWNNTSDNITSLVIFSDQTDGLGIGTTIELYARRQST